MGDTVTISDCEKKRTLMTTTFSDKVDKVHEKLEDLLISLTKNNVNTKLLQSVISFALVILTGVLSYFFFQIDDMKKTISDISIAVEEIKNNH